MKLATQHILVKPETQKIINSLKNSDKFYKSNDNLIICALTDHVLRLKSCGQLEVLYSRNPELKRLIAKLIYVKNLSSKNPVSFVNSSFSSIHKKRGNQNNKKNRERIT